MYVLVYLYVYMYLFTCVHVHDCACIWRPEVEIVSTWSSMVSSRLALGKRQRSACLYAYLPVLGLQPHDAAPRWYVGPRESLCWLSHARAHTLCSFVNIYLRCFYVLAAMNIWMCFLRCLFSSVDNQRCVCVWGGALDYIILVLLYVMNVVPACRYMHYLYPVPAAPSAFVFLVSSTPSGSYTLSSSPSVRFLEFWEEGFDGEIPLYSRVFKGLSLSA